MIAPNPESALNEEAGKLLLEEYEDYAKRARLYTRIHAQGGKSDYSQLGSKENVCEQKPVLIKRKHEEEKTVTKKKALRRL